MKENEIKKIFASNLRAERARINYTQEKLAELCGVTTEYISKIENEKACPTILVAANIAITLGVTLDTLIPPDKLKSL